jgi:hypothetical protein
MDIYKPEIKEIDITNVYGETLKVVVIPNSIRAEEAVRNQFISVSTEIKAKRITEKMDESLLSILKSMAQPKEKLIEEILLFRDSDIVSEAEMLIDKDRENRKQLVEDKVQKIKNSETKKLNEKNIDDLCKEVASLRLNANENIETMNKVWNTVLFYCVRNADDRRKQIFNSENDVSESLDQKTKELLVKEHIRVNAKRTETEGKN